MVDQLNMTPWVHKDAGQDTHPKVPDGHLLHQRSRDAAWAVIRNTPQIVYLVLTKRPELIADRFCQRIRVRVIQMFG